MTVRMASAASPIIRVEELIKIYRVHKREAGVAAAARSLFRRRYDEVRALAGIDFEIQPGERVGFLGPNGAGKTTALKILSGLLHPTSGRVEVAGFIPGQRRHDFLSQITLVMGQKQQLLWDLPAADTFELNRVIYGIERAQFASTLKMLKDLLGLTEIMHKPVRQLSLGERMKCELAAALLHQPRVLFLDEPTIGLDVTMQATMRAFIRDYNVRTGASILLTSHYMEDVAAICERVLVIDHGALIYAGTLPNLVRQLRPEKRLTIQLEKPVTESELRPFGDLVEVSDHKAVFQVPQDKLRETLARVVSALPVADLSVEDAPLEDVLRDLFKQSEVTRRKAAGE